MMEAVTVETVEGVEVAAEVNGVVSRGVMTGMEVGAAEVDWWGILGSSSSCHCSLEGSPSSVIPARISTPAGMPWEAD